MLNVKHRPFKHAPLYFIPGGDYNNYNNNY